MTSRIAAVLIISVTMTMGAQPEVPEPLRGWEAWVTWDVKHLDCPTPYNDATRHMCFWPTALTFQADANSGAFALTVTAFEDGWVPLPGSAKTWPVNVRVNTTAAAVIDRDGGPHVKLAKGTHRVEGGFTWVEMPQWVDIPAQIGVLALTLDNTSVTVPNRDANGRLWLKRLRSQPTDKDQLAVKVYRVIEDGIPMWLRTEIELSVSGKSREESLGWILPEGWRLAMVDSPIPVAVDEKGQVKAQIRAGKWRIRMDAFKTTDARRVGFAAAAEPLVDVELVAFKSQPALRMAEIEGLAAVDVTQTTFPQAWRGFAAYEWNTKTPFTIVEKMRGMGLQRPAGLRVDRQFWLDENGGGLTYRDHITGSAQQLWRLDIAPGHDLGAARINGDAQLITANPDTGAHGVEIRSRDLDIEAIGRIENVTDLAATGWQTDADGLAMTLNLPPGWRLFALFGADWVHGDWLTAWSLLDLFLLLIFTLAVGKLWGWRAGLVAFAAFGLAYHEGGAPRFTWLFLLMPLALLRVVPTASVGRICVKIWKIVAVVILLAWLIPFVFLQIQSILYPQLEVQGVSYPVRGRSRMLAATKMAMQTMDSISSDVGRYESSINVKSPKQAWRLNSNLQLASDVKIQTGPAQPEWTWNTVRCGWDGPVSSGQRARPILISLTLHRLLTLLRLALLAVLFGVLLNTKFPRGLFSKRTAAAAVTAGVLVAALAGGGQARAADIPSEQMLNTLRERLLKPAEAYPHGATIPEVSLTVADGKITMTAIAHCALDVAVPLPGRLPSWSPISVTIDGRENVALCRRDGYLWVLLNAGIHTVTVTGAMPNVTEWEWTFLLKPKRVTVSADGWKVTGVDRDGVPEDQVFFARQREQAPDEAVYDQKTFNAVAAIDRRIEVGLVWRVRNVVTRLSPTGKAVSLTVPLLPGEQVLSSNVMVKDTAVEVRLGAGDTTYEWQSELPMTETLALNARESDRWVERWHLQISPVWNVELAGLAPIFESGEQNLMPVWHPWPGEHVDLSFSRPAAVPGQTMTVRRVHQTMSLGNRQRVGSLRLDIESSMGDDCVIGLAEAAEVSSLMVGERAIPVRRVDGNLVVPVRPGKQTVVIDWRRDEAIRTSVRTEPITLPVDSANITTLVTVPESRWVLWTHGPLRGPAVRFWTLLCCALLTAWVLGGLKLSPVGRLQWLLLGLGLTQVPLGLAVIVVGWFFLLAYRGTRDNAATPAWRFNLAQVGLIVLTAAAAGVLIAAVGEGLLGNPEMFIRGNGSTPTRLQWFQPRAGTTLARPVVISCSVWVYRFLMLAWALWLAAALLRWLKWGWTQFGNGGYWRFPPPKKKTATPPIPPMPEGGRRMGTEEQGNRGTEEQGNRGTGEQRNR
ncbi:MAG: hypothetical protein RRC34_14520 [Lentisphaeria bacterium]|nr:hypothetical protein [Lentisphaeria bacterium]